MNKTIKLKRQIRKAIKKQRALYTVEDKNSLRLLIKRGDLQEYNKGLTLWKKITWPKMSAKHTIKREKTEKSLDN